MRCMGFGPREGVCRNGATHPTEEEAGGPVRRQYWCDDCEAARRDHISGQFERMLANFPKDRG
jgi:hypothetical protein